MLDFAYLLMLACFMTDCPLLRTGGGGGKLAWFLLEPSYDLRAIPPYHHDTCRITHRRLAVFGALAPDGATGNVRTYVLPLVDGGKGQGWRRCLRMDMAQGLPLKAFWTLWRKSEEKINNLQGSGHGWRQPVVSLFSWRGRPCPCAT